MTSLHGKNKLYIFQLIILSVFVGFFLLFALDSLLWRMELDTPLLHYAAFLMDEHNLVPYKDIFETSMPGTFFFHYCIGVLFGYGDLAFHVIDLTLLTALLFATYIFMSRFGRLPAIWAVVLFGLVYFSQGQTMTLQRDYLGVIPIAFSLLFIPTRRNTKVGIERFIAIGFLFGCAVMIKPHLGLGFPIVFWALMSIRRKPEDKHALDFLYNAGAAGIALLIPLFVSVIWLFSQSALESFTDIFVNYIPMHSKLTGDRVILSSAEHIKYLVKETLLLGGYSALVVAALFGCNQVVKTIDDEDDRKEVIIPVVLLALCTLGYAIYPTIAGKFWDYHYMPLAYFSTISTALCLFAWPDTPIPSRLSKLRSILPITVLLIAFMLQGTFIHAVYLLAKDFLSSSDAHAPQNGRVDEMANWLKSKLRAGDTVQPLDWSGGSIHAMLLAKAKLATSFFYDYHFYHEVSSDYTQQLRLRFLKELNEAMPRFIIEMEGEHKPWIFGIDTTHEFPELKAFLHSHYEAVFHGDGYMIYEKMRESGSNISTRQASEGSEISQHEPGIDVTKH